MAKTRHAVPADIDRLIEIRGAVRENRLSDPLSVTRSDYEDFVGRGLVWVAEVGPTVVAFAAGDDRDGSVWALFVDPEHEGQGIGTALLAGVTQDLRDAGFRCIRLSTDPGTRAEALYLWQGWIRTGVSDDGEVTFELRG